MIYRHVVSSTFPRFNKTKTGIQSAGQKTGAAFSSFGSAVTKKLGEVRESTAFKSFEDKVSTTATTLKVRKNLSNQEAPLMCSYLIV